MHYQLRDSREASALKLDCQHSCTGTQDQRTNTPSRDFAFPSRTESNLSTFRQTAGIRSFGRMRNTITISIFNGLRGNQIFVGFGNNMLICLRCCNLHSQCRIWMQFVIATHFTPTIFRQEGTVRLPIRILGVIWIYQFHTSSTKNITLPTTESGQIGESGIKSSNSQFVR